MSSCGACFSLLLPGSLELQQLLGCCLLLLAPATSTVAVPDSLEGQKSGKVGEVRAAQLIQGPNNACY